MNRITDFRIDTVECPIELWRLLPPEARKLIESYWTLLAAPAGKIRYEIPAYRWEEIEPLLAGPVNWSRPAQAPEAQPAQAPAGAGPADPPQAPHRGPVSKKRK